MNHPTTYGQFSFIRDLAYAYKLRLRRRRLLLRAWRKRTELQMLEDRTGQIRSEDILAVSTVRNEIERLPHFLDHYRCLGVSHFLFVDNGSDDGSAELLKAQKDVSLWSTHHSYKAARFGMDWLTYLQMKFATGHWCLAVDADELLVYPGCDQRPLQDLTAWLDGHGTRFFAAIMLDMHPEGAIGQHATTENPIETLPWFSAEDYSWEWKPKYRSMSIQGGPRKRAFFSDTPEHAPHLNKTPLIRWCRGDAYVSSTHLALPRYLNGGFDLRNDLPTGALLHTKFTDTVIAKSSEEKRRQEHFTYSDRYDDYYDAITQGPTLWDAQYSHKYTDWRQLEELGVIRKGQWLQDEF